MPKRKIFVSLLLLALLVKVNSTSKISINSHGEFLNLFNALTIIVKETFLESSKRLLFFTSFDSSETMTQFYVNNFLNAILADLKNVSYKVMHQHQKQFYNLYHNEVVIIDNLKTFKHFYAKLNKIGNMNLSRTLLFVSSVRSLNDETINLIFKDLYHMDVISVALIVKLSPVDIVLLTYFPFTPTACRNFKPVIINRYLPKEHRWANRDYFPNKLQDFYGCPLTCCTWKDMPYLNLMPHKHNSNVMDYMGIEAELLKYAAEKLNFSINIHWIDSKTKADINAQGTIFGKLFSTTCDFAMGGFSYRKDLDHLSPFSQTNYYFLSHIYIVTNTINVLTKYEKLAFPFHYNVWFALGLICTLTSLLICICGQRRRWLRYQKFLIGSANRTPHFYLYALAVGANMPTKHMPKRNFARFLLTCWMMTTLILRSAYQSGMYQMMRDNKQWNPPHTIESVFKQNYLISMTPENRRYLAILPDVKRLHIFNTTILSALKDVLNANEPLAFVTPYEYFGYFGKLNPGQWQYLHLVKERILTQQLTIYVRHHSYLIKEFNKKIAESHYYGFITLWHRRYVLKQATASTNAKTSVQSEVSSLSMRELGAIFVIMIWLQAFAFATFLIELIWHQYKCGIKKLWLYAMV